MSIGVASRVRSASRQVLAAIPGPYVLDDNQKVLISGRPVALLRSGRRTINLDFSVADEASRRSGFVATVFARDGDDFIRVTTSVRKQNGERAIGTPLDRSQPAYQDALRGRAHEGYVAIFGKQYLAHYLPLRDTSGLVVGILFVGLDVTHSPGMGLAALMASKVALSYGAVQMVFLGLSGKLSSAWELGLAMAMLLLLWSTTYVLMRKNVTVPLAAGRSAAQRTAAGDLMAQVHVGSSDDIGQMLLALNSINVGLTGLISNVGQSAKIVTDGTLEIAEGNGDLANRTEKQATEVNSAASAIHQLTATVAQTADQAAQLDSLVISVAKVANAGGEIVGQVVHTMGQISTSADKISDIIALIEGIAFQTNILALNAAVEAARAGEQGRGFAVVAAEVRNLAQRASKSAQEIKALINESVNSVDAGNALVMKARLAMEHITGSIAEVEVFIDGIVHATKEQHQGIQSVNRSISEIEHVTQKNAALVEHAAAAAMRMRDEATTLVGAVNTFKTHP
jgi:methyl-accepting chemotaxis protein-2 (aspartate sensor receptor)